MKKFHLLIIASVFFGQSDVFSQSAIKELPTSSLQRFQPSGQVNLATLPEDPWQFYFKEEKIKRNFFDQPKGVAPTYPKSLDKTEETSSVNNTSIIKGNNFAGAFSAGQPPDNGTAISNNNYIVHTINATINIYDTLGNTLMAPKSLKTFFGKSSGISLTDPRAVYDAYSDRFIIVMSERYSRVLIAFSQTNNPLGTWNLYTIQVDSADFGGSSEYFDYPSVMVNEYEVVISGFLLSTNYVGEKFIQIRKEDGYNGAALQTRIWDNIYDADGNWGEPSHGVEMAQQGVSYGKTIYLLSTYSIAGSKVFLYEITDSVNGTPQLNCYGINTNAYYYPLNSSQMGSSYPLETTDSRVQCAILLDGIIHFTFHDKDPATSLSRIIYSRIKVSDKTISSSVFSSSTSNYSFPSLASFSTDSTDHTVVICFLESDANKYPSISAVTCDNNMAWGTPISIKEGVSSIGGYTFGGSVRWGDYTSCVRKHNASTPTVWVSGQYGAPSNYGNWISEIKLAPGSGIQPLANNNSSLVVYPNPVASFFILQLEQAEKKDITVNIYDTEGKLVKELYKGPVNAGKASLSFNKNALSSGIYFIKVYSQNEMLKTEKIIIE